MAGGVWQRSGAPIDGVKRARVRYFVGLAVALWVSAAGVRGARADGVADEAELHFQRGAEDYQRGDFTGALRHFLASNRLVPNKNVVYNIARTFEQQKRFADAHRYYIDALAQQTDAQTTRDIRAAIARIAPNVAVLDVVTTPPGATIYLERRDLGSRGTSPRPLAVPPGSYRVIAELEGYAPKEVDAVEAKLGAETRVSLTLDRIVGTVRVVMGGAPGSGGGAAVRVGDERAEPSCLAPCDVKLPPGKHLLYFTREGAYAPARQVNVSPAKTTTVTVTLSPLTGSLLVSADERGAQILMDDRVVGFTPAVLSALPVGRHKIRVVLRGFRPVEREINIEPGRQAELTNLSLVPLREVTAVSRYTQQIDEAPSSVSIIDGREIQAFGYPTIAEALRGVRGVSVSNDRAYASANIRGVGEPNDYNNRVLLLSDGQALNENLLQSAYIGSEGRVDLHDVERIEVVRGPGSLLYGAGAFSGVINLVTRPRDDLSHVEIGVGAYDSAVLHGRGGFHYNFGPNKGIWASASGAQSDGYSLDVALEDPPAVRTAQRVEAFQSGGTAGRAWWGPVTLQWFFHARSQRVPVGAYSTTFGDPRTILSDARAMAELRFEPKLSRYFELLLRAHANRFTSRGSFASAPDAVEEYRGSWVGGEARLVFTPSPKIRVTGGGEVQGHPEASIAGSTEEGGVTSSYVDAENPYVFGAGYALVEAAPLSWLLLSGGARVDVYSTFGPIVVPRAAVIFRPAPGGVLKLMGGRGFRAPSIYELTYEDGGLSQVRADNLSPESVYSGEIEYSHRFLSDWVALGAAHASYIQGFINTVPTPGDPEVIQYVNSGSPALTVGGDVELRRDFRGGWALGAMYGYQLARYLDSSLANPRLINAPEHLASVRGVAPIVRDLVSLGLRATLDAPKRISLDSDDTTAPAVIGDITVSGSVPLFGLRFAAGIYNVADRRPEAPVAGTFASRTLPQNGRTFLVDVLATYP